MNKNNPSQSLQMLCSNRKRIQFFGEAQLHTKYVNTNLCLLMPMWMKRITQFKNTKYLHYSSQSHKAKIFNFSEKCAGCGAVLYYCTIVLYTTVWCLWLLTGGELYFTSWKNRQDRGKRGEGTSVSGECWQWLTDWLQTHRQLLAILRLTYSKVFWAYSHYMFKLVRVMQDKICFPFCLNEALRSMRSVRDRVCKDSALGLYFFFS